jgi:hypothetical protein
MIGDAGALAAAIDDAFPARGVGARHRGLVLGRDAAARAAAAARRSELSDGTLRYLLWVAALLTPRPPPAGAERAETSLHPTCCAGAPGASSSEASNPRSQVIVVSHAAGLIERAPSRSPSAARSTLSKAFGDTTIDGSLEPPRWEVAGPLSPPPGLLAWPDAPWCSCITPTPSVPEVDPQRPLSMVGRFDVERLAAAAAAKRRESRR